MWLLTIFNSQMIDNDEIVESIMRSKRRVNDIGFECFSDTENEKFFRILEKFKPHTKKFSVEAFSMSRENLFSLWIAVSDVETLELDIKELSWKTKRRFMGLKTFSKLKSLKIVACPKLCKLLEVIPDDSLEKLEVSWKPAIDAKSLQEFLNRQTRIKDLKIESFWDIDHLVLEEFSIWLYETDDYQGRLRSLLEKQPELRNLKLDGFVDETTFGDVCKLPKLEHLFVSIVDEGDRSCIGGLNNLRNLMSLELLDFDESEFEYWRGSAFLGQLKLPKLQRLSLCIEDKLDPEIFAAMSAGMGNLQQLDIDKCQIRLLPRVIECFQALKKLKVECDSTTDDPTTAPSRNNESLTALTLHMRSCPGKQTFDAIKACSNLQQFDLTVVDGLNIDLLNCLQSLPQLESFCYDDGIREDVASQEMELIQRSVLAGIIEHFRKSTSFLTLQMTFYSTHKTQLEALFEVALSGEDIETTQHFSLEYGEYYNFFRLNKKQAA